MGASTAVSMTGAGLHKLRRIFSILLSGVAKTFPRSLRPTHNKEAHELHPTAYLDALRGYAAWVVYNSHTVSSGWRSEGRAFMQLAVFQVLYKGHPMVHVFFVISGFALSYSMLRNMHHQHQSDKILDTLASSIVRRHVRLYLPTIFATFVAMVCFSIGIAKKTESPDVLQPTFLGNFWHWVSETMRLIDPFPHVSTHWKVEAQGGHYLPQLWTIPVEFRGSMFLFLFCAAVCKMNARKRGYVTLATSVACFWYQTAYAGLFLFGMWLADRQIGRANNEQAKLMNSTAYTPATNDSAAPGKLEHDMSVVEEAETEVVTAQATWSEWINYLRNGGTIPPTLPSKFGLLRQLPYIILAYLGIIFLAAPDILTTDMRFPYNIGAMLMPPTYKDSWAAQNDWPQAIGALFLSYALEHSSVLRIPLETPFSQFVGELSFGIYAMHNTVRWIVWEQYLEPWTVRFFGEDRRDIWLILPGYFAMTFLVIWAAEGFRRVDVKRIDLARRMKEHLFAD